MSYTPAPTVSGDLAQQIVTLFASAALSPLQSVLKMGSIVNRFYETTYGDVGQYVNVPVPPTFTANDLSEGGDVSPQENSLSTVQISINTHKEATFSVPDVTRTLTNVNLMRTYIQPAIIAVAEAVETDLLGLYAGLSTNTPVGAAATPITAGVIRDARKALIKSKVPDALPRFLVVNPDSYEVILADAALTAQYAVGDNQMPIQTGSLGTRYGFNIIEHQLVVATTDSATPPVTTVSNMAFASDAFALVTRRLPPITPGIGAVSADINFGSFAMRLTYSYAANQLTEQWTVSCLYGCKVLRPEFGVVLNS